MSRLTRLGVCLGCLPGSDEPGSPHRALRAVAGQISASSQNAIRAGAEGEQPHSMSGRNRPEGRDGVSPPRERRETGRFPRAASAAARIRCEAQPPPNQPTVGTLGSVARAAVWFGWEESPFLVLPNKEEMSANPPIWVYFVCQLSSACVGGSSRGFVNSNGAVARPNLDATAASISCTASSSTPIASENSSTSIFLMAPIANGQFGTYLRYFSSTTPRL
jgi:hypothetical protein